MTVPLRPYRHPITGFELPLPEGWERTENTLGCALVVVEPPRDPYFRANVVVTVERLEYGEGPQSWAERSLQALRGSLNRVRVIDVEPVRLDGGPGRRVLVHYVHDGYGGVNLEQWSRAAHGLGYVVSCSTAALEYDDLWDLTSSIATGLRLPSSDHDTDIDTNTDTRS